MRIMLWSTRTLDARADRTAHFRREAKDTTAPGVRILLGVTTVFTYLYINPKNVVKLLGISLDIET